MKPSRSLVAVALVAASLAACKKNPPPPVTPPPTNTTPPVTPPTGPDTAAIRRQQEAEAAAQRERDRLAAEAAARATRETLAEMVFFDYDQAAIRDDARSVLQRKVQILRANPNVALRIEGHADERGSVEYNLALSLRRANAIRDYLVQLGLDSSRFDVIPMGEERPVAMGTDESAYQQNRRGEFHITRGGDSLVPVGR